MQALCLAKLLLTAGERLIVGSAVSSQGFVCPLTPGMYVMTREGRAIHIMRTHRHTRHMAHIPWHAKKWACTYLWWAEDNKPCLLLFLRIYLLKQQNTFYPNLPQITSNIPPSIDSLYFCYKCYVLHVVLPYGGFHTRKRYIYYLKKSMWWWFTVYYSFGYWRWFPQKVKDEWKYHWKYLTFKLLEKYTICRWVSVCFNNLNFSSKLSYRESQRGLINCDDMCKNIT